jgi:hypothetical protein
MVWLFLEDAGQEVYDRNDAEHRCALADWLRALHACELRPEDSQCLPEVGAECFHTMLTDSLSRMAAIDRATITAGEQEEMDRILRVLAGWDARWPWVADQVSRFPRAFVHADLSSSNIRIGRDSQGQAHALVFDWELSGLGFPALDVASSGVGDFADSADRYWRPRGIDVADAAALCRVGKAMRLVATASWACYGLRPFHVNRPLRSLTFCADELQLLAAALGE